MTHDELMNDKCKFDGGTHVLVWAYDEVYSCQLCWKAYERKVK